MKVQILSLLLIATFFNSCKKKETAVATPNYTNFKILNVKISAMPFLDANASSWDPFDGPDVFFKMELQNNAELFSTSTTRFSDVTPNNLPLAWDIVNAYQITNISVAQYVTVYDYDTLDPNDRIGYVSFTMSDHKNGYPKTITKSNGGVTVTISGEWY
jgi:hypothetical protein